LIYGVEGIIGVSSTSIIMVTPYFPNGLSDGQCILSIVPGTNQCSVNFKNTVSSNDGINWFVAKL